MIKKLNSIVDRYQGAIILIVIFLSLVWVFAAPFILTKTGSWDFTKTGPIGDTIGGITAPAVGLLSAVLVAFSFRAQVKANRQINKQIKKSHEETNFNYFNNEMKDLIAQYNLIEYPNTEKGKDAIKELMEKSIKYYNKFETTTFTPDYKQRIHKTSSELKIILNQIELLLRLIADKDVSNRHKRMLYMKFTLFHTNNTFFIYDKFFDILARDKYQGDETIKHTEELREAITSLSQAYSNLGKQVLEAKS